MSPRAPPRLGAMGEEGAVPVGSGPASGGAALLSLQAAATDSDHTSVTPPEKVGAVVAGSRPAGIAVLSPVLFTLGRL